MQKKLCKPFFASLFLSLMLTTFTFAGDVHCPVAPPPPPLPEEGRGSLPPVSDYSTLSHITKEVWNFLTENANLF